MRHTVFFAGILTLSSACSACASLPAGPRRAACDRANTATLADRIADPCGFADALAECTGLPSRDRTRIFDRCQLEKLSLDQPLRVNAPCQE